jgi:hypothetical protein
VFNFSISRNINTEWTSTTYKIITYLDAKYTDNLNLEQTNSVNYFIPLIGTDVLSKIHDWRLYTPKFFTRALQTLSGMNCKDISSYKVFFVAQ